MAWPRIKAQAAPLVRLDGTVQFGLDPRDGVRLAGLSDAEMTWLHSLDGAHDPVTRGAAAGLDPERLSAILATLDATGVLVPAEIVEGIARGRFRGGDLDSELLVATAPSDSHRAYDVTIARATRAVWISGAGRLGAGLADLLRQAGVGEVSRAVGSRELLAGRRRVPDLVVLLGATPPDPRVAEYWLHREVAHLPAVLGQTAATIGPLVDPGRSACLGCVELVRTDLDPSWVWLRAQLPDAVSAPTSETALTAISAGLAARVALAHLDGAAPVAGLSLDVASPWPEVTQRYWTPHPACGCIGATSGRGVRMEA